MHGISFENSNRGPIVLFYLKLLLLYYFSNGVNFPIASTVTIISTKVLRCFQPETPYSVYVNSRLYVCGGKNADGAYEETCYGYMYTSPTYQLWKKTQPMIDFRIYSAHAVISKYFIYRT